MTTDPLRHRAFALAAIASLLVGPGCGGYPEVSPKTYEISKALYGLCNRRKAENLPIVEKLVDEALARKEITSREADWLREIVATARAGDWEEAEAEARALLESQVD